VQLKSLREGFLGMDNGEIDSFFRDAGLTDSVTRFEWPPNIIWKFQAVGSQMTIQTQASVNRMRIVAVIKEARKCDREVLSTLLEANYHSALDARYALTENMLVAVFLHPFKELTLCQFISGLYQTISCAETFGSTYSGGTMIFGRSPHGRQADTTEPPLQNFLAAVISKIKQV